MKRAVILDRDGVINDNSIVVNVNKPKDLILFEGAAEAIRRLSDAGYYVFVATNQGGVGLGYMKEQALQEIHEDMRRRLSEEGAHIDDIAACIHAPHANCACRKPKPGLIWELHRRHPFSLPDSYMVGDRETDVEAGKAAGTRTIRIGHPPTTADFCVDNLVEAVDTILRT